MPIEPLPQATVRAIGSTSVISDPCSVVKELLDNALDASASNVQIEISQNTVDVIQVKDNGHGIPSEDYSNVCKHTFTSKIQTIEDLRNVGGTSFGFRGEALASAAEISGGLVITTRVLSDVTASCLYYGRDGELTKTQRTSHPVGTSVRITDFLKNIPVRRQNILKSGSKTLIKIKRLVQSYALARPSTRLSLKVLKAKNENNNWTYAPGPVASLPDAVIKTFGREVSSCCVSKKIPTDVPGEEIVVEGGYGLIAFLPTPNSELSKVNGKGQFCSVDGRPLSNDRGIGHDISKLFKSYVRTAATRNGETKSITDPFLCVQLSCPEGTYDVNIEPSKDDVLFENRDHVISIVDQLFSSCYGPLGEKDREPIQSPAKKSSRENNQFDILLASRRQDLQAAQPAPTALSSEVPAHSPELPSTDVRTGEISPGAVRSSTSTFGNHGSRYINPWSVTRMNASFQTPKRDRGPQPTVSERTPQSSSPEQPRPRNLQRLNALSEPESPEIISPPLSRVTSTSPVAHRARPRSSNGSNIHEEYHVNRAKKAARERDKERYGNGALDTWFQRITQGSIQQRSLEDTSEIDSVAPPLSQLAEERFGSPKNTQDTSTSTKSSHDKDGNDDQAEPDASEAHGYQGSMDSGRGFPVLERWAAKLHEGFNPETQAEIDKALDFERRKKEALQTRRMNLVHGNQSSSKPTSSQSPHHSRFLKAKATLFSEDPFATETTTSEKFSAGDPRKYLLSHQSDQSGTDYSEGGKAQRQHTRRLPFERIPDGCSTHDLGISISSKTSLSRESIALIAPHDAYARSGLQIDPFALPDIDAIIPFWNGRLRELLKMKVGSHLPATEEVEISSAIVNHLKTSVPTPNDTNDSL